MQQAFVAIFFPPQFWTVYGRCFRSLTIWCNPLCPPHIIQLIFTVSLTSRCSKCILTKLYGVMEDRKWDRKDDNIFNHAFMNCYGTALWARNVFNFFFTSLHIPRTITRPIPNRWAWVSESKSSCDWKIRDDMDFSLFLIFSSFYVFFLLNLLFVKLSG